ncbi:IgA peptidase M64-domain-containing protein [Mycena floridula]|nr:IgA peptidase M64-domain-containing protein [Mycena floridula]
MAVPTRIAIVAFFCFLASLAVAHEPGDLPSLGKSWFQEHSPAKPRGLRFLPAATVQIPTSYAAQKALSDSERAYLVEEKDKFFEDAMRLAVDISGNHTFNTVKPLLNFWAAFSPSTESGVGVGGVPKDTPFGLYRDGTELRGVYYSKPEAAAAACRSMGEQCDYPILLGNDPLYGGLGGRFTVITSSIANGALILRHELGHSIINVGEEYDGGYGYFGVNAYHNLSLPVPWSHWMTEPPKAGKQAQVERSVMPLQIYAWTMLNASESWSAKFISSGTFSHKRDVKLELDGLDLGWEPKEGLGVDRWHYDFYIDGALTGGEHELKFTLLNPELEGVAQLCSAEILEFGDKDEFRGAGYYGVYPTYSDKNLTTYRPTNEDCLMRVVTTPDFCTVCVEGLWYSLLSRVSLIEEVKESCSGLSKNLHLTVVPLAEFRQVPIDVDESWTITWSHEGKVISEFTNKTTLSIDGDALGSYQIQVEYTTAEIRVNKGLTIDTVVYEVKSSC